MIRSALLVLSFNDKSLTRDSIDFIGFSSLIRQNKIVCEPVERETFYPPL